MRDIQRFLFLLSRTWVRKLFRSIRTHIRLRWCRFWGEMAALNSKALQEQLSAIMAALTRAAVAEICELVEEGYSLLQVEISRSRRENQDLKKKLHLIESIVVRGGSGAAGTLVPAAEPRGAPQQQQPDTEHGAPAAEVKKLLIMSGLSCVCRGLLLIRAVDN